MKFIHTSDWHIGQSLRSYDRSEEFLYFCEQLCQIVRREKPDALLVAGDIFDVPVPQAFAQDMFVKAGIKLHEACPGMEIIVTAGNHDSGSRLNINRPLWSPFSLRLCGACRKDANGIFDPAELVINVNGKGLVIAAPYFHPRNFPVAEADKGAEDRQSAFFAALLAKAAEMNPDGRLPIVMMAHLAVEGTDISCHSNACIGGMKTERAEALGGGYDYLALGHIHKPQTLNPDASCGMMRYSGTPMPMSFSEDFPHSVTLVEIAGHGEKPQITEIQLDLLRKVKTIMADDGTFAGALQMLSEWPDDDPSYLRIMVKASEMLPRDAREKVEMAAAGKQARFCNIEKAPADPSASSGKASERRLSIAEIKSMSPVKLAEKAYKLRTGLDLPDGWAGMIQHALDKVESNKQAAL